MRDKLLLRLATVIALAIAGFGAWASYGHAATTTVIAPTYGYDRPGTFVHSVSSSPLHQAGSAASRAARVEGAFEPIGFVTGVAAEDAIDLTTPAARSHILEGEARPNGSFGGHRPGTGFPRQERIPERMVR